MEPHSSYSMALRDDEDIRDDEVRRRRTGALVKESFGFLSKLGLVLLAKVFVKRAWRALQVVSFSHSLGTSLGVKLPPVAKAVVQPVQPLELPVMSLTLSRPVFRVLCPQLYRSARFWKRLLPIYARYMITKLHTRRMSTEDKNKTWARRHEWGGEMVHQLVLDMSGFYVKSAQILATKADLVPDAWRRWLSKHLDDAPPRPFGQVKKSIEQELSRSQNGTVKLDAVFSHIDKEPLASASIAQVHGAVLHDGTRVVVKVQHLGMEQTMRSDLHNLARVARFLKGQLPVDLVPIVKEIQETIPLEFNFEREVWFMTRIKTSLEANGFTSIVCPFPVAGLCTQRLIVMQRLDGIPFTRILSSEADQARLPEVKRAVNHLILAYGQMLLLDGVFHADPHAGNLMLLPDGRLALLDYGQSKVLSEAAREQVARMVLALANEDDQATAEVLLDMGINFKAAEGGEVPVSVLALMARMLFDTCYVEEATVSPMAGNSILRKVPMTSFNQELWLVVRMILILRGLMFSLRMDVSAAGIWKAFAEAYVHKLPG